MREIQKKIQYIIDLKKELAFLHQLTNLPEDLVRRCEAFYNHEINELLEDPYVYDKYYGMLHGGII